MHGTVLVFFVLTGGLSGTFANFLIPLQIGARDMASPMLNMLSYWFFWLASVIMITSLFIETGPASGGWTIYPPLSALGDANLGSKGGMDTDCGDGLFCGILFTGGTKLYHDYSEYAHQGDEHDQTAPDHLGHFVYSHIGGSFLSGASFRSNIIAVRPACRYEFLSL
jgi:hypothetical protein